MRPIGLCGVSILLNLLLISCEDRIAEQSRYVLDSGQVKVSRLETQDTFIAGIPSDTEILALPRVDSIKALPPNKLLNQTVATPQNPIPPGYPKDPRRFTRITERIADSLRATPGAVARLHPEDYAIFREHIFKRKLLVARKDPKTGNDLPFPYAYPDRYGADIRRLDSIKAAEALKINPPQRMDSIPKPPN